MTNPEEFYKELESFAREEKCAYDKSERMSGCAVLFFSLLLTGFFVGLSWAMFHLGREIHDFRSCGQTTMGVVISRQHDHKSYYDIAVCYTPSGGRAQVFMQRTKGAGRYPLGSSVPVRYREGQAFIDNGKENKHYNLVLMAVVLIFWSLIALLLGGIFYRVFIRTPRVLLRRWLRRS